MAITEGTSVTQVTSPSIPDQATVIVPVLQAQDGTFVGTVQAGEDFTSYMIAFDAAGNLLWSVEGEEPRIATDDGGVIAQSGTIYDQSGSVTGQIASFATPSWSMGAYSPAGGGLSAVVQSPVLWATSFQTVASGNPSGNATSVPFVTWLDGLAFWAAPRGPQCKLGSSQAALGGGALQKYNDEKQALINGGYLTSGACSTFFNAPTRASYSSQLVSAVNNQVAYDGTFTTISMYAAGLWTAKDTTNILFPAYWQKIPVCAMLQNTSGANRANVALAQTQPPATDTYINTKPKIFTKYLLQSTILHEALHNLTHLGDTDLELLLGITPTPGVLSHVINTTLVSNNCAAR
jgi:hypothetical protein